MREHESAQNTDTTVNQWNTLHFHQRHDTTRVDAKNIVTPEDQLDPIETYEEITTASYFETGGLPESFVERLGVSDVRVLTIHINSAAFRNSILRVRDTLRAIFAKALMSYVDFHYWRLQSLCEQAV